VLSGAWDAAGTFVLDVVYPRRCAGCGTRGTWLCDRCQSAFACFAGPVCWSCGIPVAIGVCRCDELPAAIHQVRSVGPYGEWIRGAVVRLKYHGEWARSRHLALLLAEAASELLPADALVPVPLHSSRRKQRGFNQTEKLAEALSAVIDVPVQLALQRTRRTVAQVRLDAERRQGNVKGAFALSAGQSVRGKRLILVDDVITTGATLGACAEVLRAAGADAVNVVTVAREL
jgi:ComF family protein